MLYRKISTLFGTLVSWTGYANAFTFYRKSASGKILRKDLRELAKKEPKAKL
jgi:hypothetical protein